MITNKDNPININTAPQNTAFKKFLMDVCSILYLTLLLEILTKDQNKDINTIIKNSNIHIRLITFWVLGIILSVFLTLFAILLPAK